MLEWRSKVVNVREDLPYFGQIVSRANWMHTVRKKRKTYVHFVNGIMGEIDSQVV